MPTTRSATKQAKINDFTDKENNIKPTKKVQSTIKTKNTAKAKVQPEQGIPKKRAEPDADEDSEQDTSSTKKSKQDTTGASESKSNESKSIQINRSPVLQLWGAMVSQFKYPHLKWEACLSIGNAISALCAVSKGRAIGAIEPKEEDDETEGEESKVYDNKNEKSIQMLRVMGFSLSLDGSKVIMGGKAKGLNEDTLRSKFGHEEYELVKEAMAKGLESWKDESSELDRKAFRMYERFRPSVPKGQKGWGSKGELDLGEVTNVIMR